MTGKDPVMCMCINDQREIEEENFFLIRNLIRPIRRN